MRFVPPPGWPEPPPGWTPPPGWEPDPTWPLAPTGWQFWQDSPDPRLAGAGSSVAPGRRHEVAAAVGVGVLLLALALGLSLVAVLRPSRVAPPPTSPTPARVVQTTTVTGWVRLDDAATARHDCEGQGRNADVGEGTAVVVTDQTGTALGTGSLTQYGSEGSRCTYTFSIAGIPVDRPGYTARVAERPPVVASGPDLRSAAWSFDVVL